MNLAVKEPEVICPLCRRPAVRTMTYHGLRHDCCGLHSWGGKPLETPETLTARKRAHQAFDPFWQNKIMSRNQAYRKLAYAMALTRRECHIGLMDKRQAEMVVRIVKEWSL